MTKDDLIDHVRDAIAGLRDIPSISDRADTIQAAGERFTGHPATAEDLFDLATEFQCLAEVFLRRGERKMLGEGNP